MSNSRPIRLSVLSVADNRQHVERALRQELHISIKTLESACRRKLDEQLCRKAAVWLNKPNARFAGQTPVAVARQGGAGRVRYELENLLTGIDRVIERHLRPILLAESNCARFLTESRQYRRKAGMTVRELAAKTDVPEKTIRRIEKGDVRWIRLGQIRELAYALNWRPHILQPQKQQIQHHKNEV